MRASIYAAFVVILAVSSVSAMVDTSRLPPLKPAQEKVIEEINAVLEQMQDQKMWMAIPGANPVPEAPMVPRPVQKIEEVPMAIPQDQIPEGAMGIRLRSTTNR